MIAIPISMGRDRRLLFIPEVSHLGDGGFQEVTRALDWVAKVIKDNRTDDLRETVEVMVEAGLHRRAPTHRLSDQRPVGMWKSAPSATTQRLPDGTK